MKIPKRRRPSHAWPRLETLEARALMANAGAFDPTFGAGHGFVTLPDGLPILPSFSTTAQVAGLAVQADGKVVIAGTIGQDLSSSFVVERLNADGSIDSGFGQGGLFLYSLPGPAAAQRTGDVTSVLLQADGKIVVAGNANRFSGNASDRSFLALRVNSNGTLDTSYGTGGVVSNPFDPTGMDIGRLAIVEAGTLLPDGRVLLAGSAPQGPSGGQFAAVRLNTDGSIDTTFGSGGTALAPITVNGITSGVASGVAVQSDGRILLAGSVLTGNGTFGPVPGSVQNFYDGAVVRLNADGTVDATYGGPTSGGKVLLPPDPTRPTSLGVDRVLGAALQPDGKLLLRGSVGQMVAGFSLPTNPTLSRLNPDGTVDTGFGQGGRVTVSLTGPAALQADGKIVVAGSIALPQDLGLDNYIRTVFAAQRLNADGSIDSSFGNTATPGLAQYSFGARNIGPQATALAIQPDGSLLLGGITSNYVGNFKTTVQFAAARVLTRPSSGPGALPQPLTPPAAFDGSGLTTLSVYLPAFGSFAYRPLGVIGDQFIPFGIPGAGQTIPAAADYFGTGQTQVAAYLPNQGAYAVRPPIGPDVIVPFGVSGPGQSIPAPADYEGIGRADIAVYMPAYGSFGIRPSTGGPDRIIPFGIAGLGQSIPTPGDYEGTGKAEISVYLPTLGAFAIRPSTGGPDRIIPFGVAGIGQSIPAPGDYDGSGRTELAVYIPSQGVFAYRPANGGPDVLVRFGTPRNGSIPVPGDYTGSGHAEIALYDPNSGTFAYRPADGSPDVITSFGSRGLGASLPAAAPAGVAATAAPRAAAVTPNPPSNTTVTARSVAVPGGPMASLVARRVSKFSVFQAVPDPSGIKS